ncbi:MAG: hypothetical protein KAV87_42615, partial [Desulfobacteraceae bacterium]|nr:hypothetical protein [Desulfobacteraceae bacterium]
HIKAVGLRLKAEGTNICRPQLNMLRIERGRPQRNMLRISPRYELPYGAGAADGVPTAGFLLRFNKAERRKARSRSSSFKGLFLVFILSGEYSKRFFVNVFSGTYSNDAYLAFLGQCFSHSDYSKEV